MVVRVHRAEPEHLGCFELPKERVTEPAPWCVALRGELRREPVGLSRQAVQRRGLRERSVAGPHLEAIATSYVARMVIAESMRPARSAGIQHAPTPTAAIITVTPMNVVGSCGAMPKSSPRMTPAAK